ncbi:MAG TPA: hypothetical protein VFH56_02310 [Acidimicrobiales bacterium]|nr:hypothetical protein [Acidimicrobiales bacterium]
MPKNNSLQRRATRKAEAKHRSSTYDMEYGTVAQREAKRGYPARLDTEQAKATSSAPVK